MLGDAPHFYIDQAPPDELHRILGILPADEGLTLSELRQRIEPGSRAKFRSEWPKRLTDLGLANSESTGRVLRYRLSALGVKVLELQAVAAELVPDVFHFLHSAWDDSSQCPPYLWSYRTCCDIAWNEKRYLGSREVAARVQALMFDTFRNLDYQAPRGARFDSRAARSWFQWVNTLEPSPFPNGQNLHPRSVTHYELALLALDRVYSICKYRYGDPVILDDTLLDRIAAVFFLDLACCRRLLDLAARLTRAIRLADTFAGTSITLLEPYNIERI